MKTFVAGTYKNQNFYKSFQPNLINRFWEVNDMEVLKLLSLADRQIGRLDMYSEYVNIDLFIQMHIAKEATQSSKIEGTQTNIEEAFLKLEDIAQEKKKDWEEVQNYISAMNYAVEMLHTLPFSSRLIKKTHEILLRGVRGEHKTPGIYRISQNWIGGASINDAVFIPPIHQTINDLMADIEIFANDTLNPMPDLLKVALIHYQFETIHPFLDGNGRVGRLLITLYLVNQGILKRPILYLSDFFERNRQLYYDNLMRVRTHNDIAQWFKFFLTGIIETAKNGVETFNDIMKLSKQIDEKIIAFGARSTDARLVIDYLYTHPIIDAAKVGAVISKKSQSAYQLLDKLEKANILTEITGSQRNRLYMFKSYLDLFKN
ncbi:MAG: Fic family protein [Chitinophagales bacterium]|nr:Fic family protein [Chitinophagales bacterium]